MHGFSLLFPRWFDMKTQATGLTNQMQDWKWLRLGHTRVFPRLAEFTQFLTGSARFSFYLFIYLFIYLSATFRQAGPVQHQSWFKRGPVQTVVTRESNRELHSLLCVRMCVGFLMSSSDQYREDTGDGAYSLSSLSEQTKTWNHFQMSEQDRTFSSVILQP